MRVSDLILTSCFQADILPFEDIYVSSQLIYTNIMMDQKMGTLGNIFDFAKYSGESVIVCIDRYCHT